MMVRYKRVEDKFLREESSSHPPLRGYAAPFRNWREGLFRSVKKINSFMEDSRSLVAPAFDWKPLSRNVLSHAFHNDWAWSFLDKWQTNFGYHIPTAQHGRWLLGTQYAKKILNFVAISSADHLIDADMSWEELYTHTKALQKSLSRIEYPTNLSPSAYMVDRRNVPKVLKALQCSPKQIQETVEDLRRVYFLRALHATKRIIKEDWASKKDSKIPWGGFKFHKVFQWKHHGHHTEVKLLQYLFEADSKGCVEEFAELIYSTWPHKSTRTYLESFRGPKEAGRLSLTSDGVSGGLSPASDSKGGLTQK